MKSKILIVLFLLSACISRADSSFLCDFYDHTFDGDPYWLGEIDYFDFEDGWLRGNLTGKAKHASIAVESNIFPEADWAFYYRHECPLNAGCLARVWLAADRINLHNARGYYVEMGGDGVISLKFRGDDETLTLCETQPMLTGESGKVYVEVSRKNNGEWELWVGTKPLWTDKQGSAIHDTWHNCQYTGIYIAATDASERRCHYFDDFYAGGEEETPQGEDIGYQPDDPDDPGHQPDAVEAADGTLLINEIMFHPEQGGQEYIEIINLTDQAIDLTGVTLTTRTSNGKFNTGNIFPEGSYVMPHDVAALTANATLLAQQFGMGQDTTRIFSTRWRQALNNTSQTLFLLNEDKTLCFDSVYYHKNYHHVQVSDDSGVSLERLGTTLPSMERDTWHSAAAPYHGTPGQHNSQHIDTDKEYSDVLRAEPEAFSPDGDGEDDICLLYYNMPKEGYTATIRLFTPTGMLVATIADNALLAQSGYIIWDGRTNKGNTAQIGIYALVMQATHPNGKALKKKIPVVVTGK
ncbi:MAG: lamin tail domain-containing protein [Paludibacteraceae bacterium]|nr:lamin tail domain-containing protein [Paludibacteraceae bacterium]